MEELIIRRLEEIRREREDAIALTEARLNGTAPYGVRTARAGDAQDVEEGRAQLEAYRNELNQINEDLRYMQLVAQRERIQERYRTLGDDYRNARGDDQLQAAIYSNYQRVSEQMQELAGADKRVEEITNRYNISADRNSAAPQKNDESANRNSQPDNNTPSNRNNQNQQQTTGANNAKATVNTNKKWGPLTPEEIDDAIQLGFTEYTPGDEESFDRFLIDHGYNPGKLKAEKDATTRNSNTNKGWGPLTPEEIDDAIQLGFTEYTPGDGESFDRFLIDHGYNPEKLKEQADRENGKKAPDKNTQTKTKEPVEIGSGAIGEGLSLESELRRIFRDNGITVNDDDIKNLAKNNKAEINGKEYQVDYSGADGFDYTDEPATPFKLIVMREKEQEKKPEGPVTGAAAGTKDPVTPNPAGGAAAAAKTPTTPDSVDSEKAADWGIDSGAGATFTTGNPNKNAPTEPVNPSAIHAASSPVVTNIDNNQISSEIKYNGDNYVLSRSVNGKVEDEAKFTFFEEAEVRSNRKRISIMKNDSSIAQLLKAHPEITKKQLKMADPTILKGLAIDKKYYGLALSYLQELGKGKNANKEKIKDSELGDISISYNVPADDSKFGFMKKMAKNHKNIADIKLPSFADRIKGFFGIGQDVFGKPEEKPALAPAKEEVKKSRKPGELSPEEKKEVNERTEKLSMAKKRIDAAREKRLKMSQEEFRASLDEEDLAMYDALTEESDKIAFRKCEPNMRYTFANRGNSEPQIKE